MEKYSDDWKNANGKTLLRTDRKGNVIPCVIFGKIYDGGYLTEDIFLHHQEETTELFVPSDIELDEALEKAEKEYEEACKTEEQFSYRPMNSDDDE